jgi:hypothetical protein
MPWRLSSASSLVSKLWVVSISTMALLRWKTSLLFSGGDLLRAFDSELAGIEGAAVGMYNVAARFLVNEHEW